MVESGYDPFGVGPFAVGVRTLQLEDRVRGRRLPCELWYPTDLHPAAVGPGDEVRDAVPVRASLPLVVFSHLSGGHRRSSTFLCRHLAGHGYAVAASDHSEVVAPELAATAGESASARQARVAAIVASRVPDVRSVLTTLLDDRRGPAGDVRLDGMRVAVVGHSFGGWTALATPDSEPRVRAVAALAPGGASRPRPGILSAGLSFAWGRDVSTLFLAGDEDVMTPLDGITELFERAPATKRMFVVRGADHLHFVDDVEDAHESLRQGTLPGEAAWIPAAMRPLAQLCPPAQAHEAIRGLTLAHLDTTLRGDREAEGVLEWAASGAGSNRGIDPAPHQRPARHDRGMTPAEPVNLTAALASFDQVYSPRIVARMNDYDVRIAHTRGEHVWHVHEDTDEFFLVLEGQFDVSLRDADGAETTVVLRQGDTFVVPKGTEHKPSSPGGAILMFEPTGTSSTGDRHEGEIPDHVDSTTGHQLG